ncbi:MOSC domain-containing protein [Pseudoalteromonas sp. B193]
MPCFKLAIALNNKNSLKLFTQHYCTGVYFRVLEQGVAKRVIVLLSRRKPRTTYQ